MMSIWRNFKDKKKTTIPSQSRKTTPQFSEGDTKEGWIVKGLRKVSFTSMNRACSTSVPSTPRSGGSLLADRGQTEEPALAPVSTDILQQQVAQLPLLGPKDADTDSLAQSLPLPSSLDKPNDCPEPVDSVSQLPVHGHAKLAILADDASGSSTLPCIERAGASEEICIPSDAQDGKLGETTDQHPALQVNVLGDANSETQEQYQPEQDVKHLENAQHSGDVTERHNLQGRRMPRRIKLGAMIAALAGTAGMLLSGHISIGPGRRTVHASHETQRRLQAF